MTATPNDPPALPPEAAPLRKPSRVSRLAQHVRDQNWMAVAIEFLLIVFGVFLGFQLTAWNEGQTRDIRNAYQPVLDRYHAFLPRVDGELRSRWRVDTTKAPAP